MVSSPAVDKKVLDAAQAFKHVSRKPAQKSLAMAEPTRQWKPLMFVDLRVPCLEYAAAAEVDILRMSDDDQLAIDDLISLLERFEATPSAPDLGLRVEKSLDKLPVYRMRLELAHQELHKRNALLEKAQVRHVQDAEKHRQMREAYLKEVDQLRNQMSLIKHNPKYEGQEVEFIPSEKRGRKSSLYDDGEDPELTFFRDQNNALLGRVRALEAKLKQSQNAVPDLLKRLQGMSGAELAEWLRNQCGLTDESLAQLLEALGGTQMNQVADEPSIALVQRVDVPVPVPAALPVPVPAALPDANSDEVIRLRRMLDNMVRFDRAARLAKCASQQTRKMWTRHEVDFGQFGKAPNEYIQALHDNQEFLDNPTRWTTQAHSENEFLKVMRPACFDYPPPLLDPRDQVKWPNFDLKMFMIVRDMVHDSSSSDEGVGIRVSQRNIPSTFAPMIGNVESSLRNEDRPDIGEGGEKAGKTFSAKSSESSTPFHNEISEARTERKRHAEIGKRKSEKKEKKVMPVRCPYCARCLLEPDPFDYKRWRYHKPESAFKRPEDIDVEAFVRRALIRRGQVKVFDRLFYKKFNEPWQRKRGLETSPAPVAVPDQSRDASVEPDQDCGDIADTLETTISTAAPETLMGMSAGALKTLDLSFGDSSRVRNADIHRKVWEFESQGAVPSLPSRTGQDRASSATLRRAEQSAVIEGGPATAVVPTLDARWKALAPLHLRSNDVTPLHLNSEAVRGQSLSDAFGSQKTLRSVTENQECSLPGPVRPVRSAGHCRQRHQTTDEQRGETSSKFLETLWQQRSVCDCSAEDLDHFTSPRGLRGSHTASNGGDTIRSVLDGKTRCVLDGRDPKTILRPKKALARCGSAPNFRRRGSHG